MNSSYECTNCGNIVSVLDDKCPYCGSFRAYKSQSSTFNKKPNTFNYDNINWVLFIILLIIFPPAGIIYLIIKYAESSK